MAAQKTVEECRMVIGQQQRRIELLEEKERILENVVRIEAEERNKALEKVAEQQESDRLMALELQGEEKRQRLMEEQEATWIMNGMDWDQDFWNENGFNPDDTGANLNSKFLKYPCNKCDKKYVTDKQLEEHIKNVHKVSPTDLADNMEYTCNSCSFKSKDIQIVRSHIEVHMENINNEGPANQTKIQEYTCNSCDFKSNNDHNMRSHVKFHKKKITCKICQYENEDATVFIEHVIKNHSYEQNHNKQTSQQSNIECYGCGDQVKTRKDLAVHRREKHYKEKLCRFYHGNGLPCRFPENVCVDIHESYETQPRQQPQQQQRPTVIQQNSKYRKTIPCRDGLRCGWLNSNEGCRYFHKECKSPDTTAVSNEQLKELINLVQAGLNLRENEPEVPDISNTVDFPRIGYRKSKSD